MSVKTDSTILSILEAQNKTEIRRIVSILRLNQEEHYAYIKKEEKARKLPIDIK